MEATTKTLARVNKIDILLVENGAKLVPIRPICDALGIAYQGQIDKIKTDEILGSTLMPSMTVGADKKEREMMCIPYRFVFGWLFSINPKNVAPEAREAVLKYKLECYNVLYNHFTAHAEFYEYKQSLVYEKNTQLRIIKSEFNTAKTRLEEAKKEFDEVMDMKFEDWQAQKQQLKIEFIENKEEVTNG